MSRMYNRPIFRSSIPEGTPRSTGYPLIDEPKPAAPKPPRRMGTVSEIEQQAQHAVLVQKIITQTRIKAEQDRAEHARAANLGKDLGKESDERT